MADLPDACRSDRRVDGRAELDRSLGKPAIVLTSAREDVARDAGRRRRRLLQSPGSSCWRARRASGPEVGLALLGERAHALLLVLGREEGREEDRLVGEPGAEVALQRAVGGVLRRRERDRALLRQRGGRLQRAGRAARRRVDRADEPDPERLRRVDRAAGQDQVLRERRRRLRGRGAACRPSPG